MKEARLARVELRTLSTTGGHQVWPAAARLLEQLEQLEPDGAEKTVAELGAGTGWLGLTLALRRPGWHVVLSEQRLEAAQELLRHNLALNEVAGRVTVAVADFFDATVEPSVAEADLLIASDVVYTRELAAAFPVFVRRALSGDRRLLYCHTFGRYDFVDRALLAACAAAGLRVRQVREDGTLGTEEKEKEEEEEEWGDEYELFPAQQCRLLCIDLP